MSDRARRHAAFMLAAIGVLAAAGFVVLPRPSLAYDLWYQAFGAAAAIAICIGVRRHRPAAAVGWIAVALSQVAFAAGDAFYTVAAATGHEVAFPGWADACYLAGYPALAIGVVVILRRSARQADWGVLIDAAVITAGVGTLFWVFLVEPTLSNHSIPLSGRLVSSAYPMMDLLLVAIAARVILAGDRRRPWILLLAASLMLMFGGDVVYMANLGDIRSLSSAVDLFWICSYTCLGAAALHPSIGLRPAPSRPSATDDHLGSFRVCLLAVAAFVSVLMAGAQALRIGSPALIGTMVTTIALFALIVARLARMLRRIRRSAVREQTLRQCADQLVAVADRAAIHEAAVETAVALAETPGTWAVLAGDDEDNIHILAARGDEVPEEEALRAAVAERADPGTEAYVSPVTANGHTHAFLIVGPVRGLPFDAIEALAAQLSLAFERLALTDALHEHESAARFKTLVSNSVDIIAVLDDDLTIRYHTPSVCASLGFDDTELLGSALTTLVAEVDAGDAARLLAEVSSAPGAHATAELRLRHRDGALRTAEVVVRNLLHDPSIRGLVVTAHDVTERLRLTEELSYQAFHDALTDLANRPLFYDRVGHALHRLRRTGDHVAVLFLDLDDFKAVNDTFGHAAGDELLVEIAQRISGRIRAEDTCARLGGDEFAVLLERADVAQARAVAEDIARSIAQPVSLRGTDVFVRGSIGIAAAAAHSTTDQLLGHADVAMYQAKATRTGIECFEPAMRGDAVDRLRTRMALQEAIGDDAFVLHYQPIVDLRTGQVPLCEALIRWERRDGSLVHPRDFIELAEETGLIVPLGRWVLHEACREARTWLDAADDPDAAPCVSVNVSPRQLQHPDLVDDVRDVLTECHLPPAKLVLEITESIVLSDVDGIVARLRELTTIGVRIAIDDFGTGYSSLSYLRRLNADILKIAKPFVDEIDQTGTHAPLLEAIVGIGSTLRMLTVAEGVEADHQLEVLRALGCDLAQGNRFAGAMPSAALGDYLRLASGRASSVAAT